MVVIIQPASAAPALTETMSRLRGELLSLGLGVAIAERPGPGAQGTMDPRSWLERDTDGRGPDAVIDVDPALAAVDIWVLEKKSRRAQVSRVTIDPARDADPGQLAIRAVEVLRSSLLANDLTAQAPRPPAVAGVPAAVAENQTRTDADHARHLDLEAGAIVVASLDGVGPALTPVARIGWAPRPWFMLQATLAGFGSRPEVTTTSGSARIAQQYGLVGGCICPSAADRIGLTLAFATGALRTTIDGQTDPPAQAHSVERWSLLLDGSVGARLRLPGRYHLTMAAHVQFAEPYVAIYFVDSRVATTGRPNLLVSLTVGAWL